MDGFPLSEDSSTRNFDSERAGYVANVVEQALLLLRDMDELRSLKKHKLFLSVKRNLALVRLTFLFLKFRNFSLVHFACALLTPSSPNYSCTGHPGSTGSGRVG